MNGKHAWTAGAAVGDLRSPGERRACCYNGVKTRPPRARRSRRVSAAALLALLLGTRSWAQSTAPPKQIGSGVETPLPQIPDAAVTGIYTLPQLIDRGERANPQTRIAWERRQQAADQTVIARSPLFPTISLTTVALRGDLLFGLPPNLSSEGVVKINSTIVTPAVKLAWTPIDFGANLASYRAAKDTQAATSEQATATEQQVALAISQDYYALVAAKEARQSADSNYAALKVEKASTDLAYAHGLVSVIKRDQVTAQALSAYSSLVTAKANLQQARIALAAEVNLQANEALDVPPLGDEINARWVDSSVDDLVKTAARERPELLEALHRIEAARQEQKSAHAALFPTVSITAEEQYTHSTSSNPATNSAAAAASSPNVDGNTYVVAANLNWDIFTAGAKRARVRDAASQLRQSELELRQLTLDVQQQVWQSYTDVEAALVEQQAAEAALAAAREYFDSASIAAAHGLGNEVPLTSAQAALAQAQSAYLSARTHTLQLAAKLAYSTGQLLSFGPIVPRAPGAKP